MAINGRALTIAGIGTIFVWSGIKGWSVLGTIGDAVTGKQPSQSITNPLVTIGGSTASNAGVLPGIGQSIASFGIGAIALEYKGHAYRFGGAPGKDGSKPWDCSSFVNWIVSVKAGKAIPGYGPGKYQGTIHGPPTGSWAIWSGLTSIKRSEVQAGDILIWLGHMGIAINNTQMISALNPHEGTQISTIDKGVGRGPLVRIGRLK
jgi:hypothetical protein